MRMIVCARVMQVGDCSKWEATTDFFVTVTNNSTCRGNSCDLCESGSAGLSERYGVLRLECISLARTKKYSVSEINCM